MKKKTRQIVLNTFSVLLVSALFLISCRQTSEVISKPEEGSSDDVQEEEVDDHISPDNFDLVSALFDAHADAEDKSDSTKTALVAGNKIIWNQGDKVKFYYYSGTRNFTEATVKHGGSSTSTIDGWVNAADTYYYAFYPVGVTSSVSYEGKGSFTVTIPEAQNGNFADCHLAIGKANKTDRSFNFSNVGSYLKVKVANTDAISLTIEAINPNDKITGTFTANFKDDAGALDEDNITVGSSKSSVTLNLDKNRAANTTYYIAVLPGATFSQGFLAYYSYADGQTRPAFLYEAPDGGRKVARKSILNLGNMDDRIIGDYFFKASGGLTSLATSGAGATWEKALDPTVLPALLNFTGDDAMKKARARALDGVKLHFAQGTYAPGSTLDMSPTENTYGKPVAINCYGGYPSDLSGKATPTRQKGTDYASSSVISGNKSHRIFNLGVGLAISFDNFTFKDAKADLGSGSVFHVGTNQATAEQGGLTLTHCKFLDNVAENQNLTSSGSGAGVMLYSGMVSVDDCWFENGVARNGGGICVYSSPKSRAKLTVTNSTFKGNQAIPRTGGAISANGGQVAISKCHFEGNKAEFFGGAVHWDVKEIDAEIAISGCTFTGNYLDDTNSNEIAGGGAISCQSGSVSVTGSTFTENYAPRMNTTNVGGGAIWVGENNGTKGDITISESSFTGNYATKDGGAIWAENGNVKLTGTNTFTGNYCIDVDSDGDGNVNTYGYGGALALTGANASVNITGNTTFSENYTFFGGGAIFVSGGTFTAIKDASGNGMSVNDNYLTNNSVEKEYCGAGMFINPLAELTVSLTGCTFDSNKMMKFNNKGFIGSEGASLSIVDSVDRANFNFTAKNCLFTNTKQIEPCRNGGAIMLEYSGNNTGEVRFVDCDFTKNISWNVGGVVTHKAGCVYFDNCEFKGNKAGDNNGWCSGVYHINYPNAKGVFTDCTIENNSVSKAPGGGGAFCNMEAGTLEMTNCTFKNNKATGTAGAVIRMEQGNPTLTLMGCVFEGNTSTNSAGAISVESGTLKITSSTGAAGGTMSAMRGNTTTNGKGQSIWLKSGTSSDIDYCEFDAANNSGVTGSLIYVEDGGTLNMTGSIIKNFDKVNKPTLSWNNVEGENLAVTMNLNACTFEGNKSDEGGVFKYLYGSKYTLNIQNCIFYKNESTGMGGAISTYKGLSLPGCTFNKNEATSGGAICMSLDVDTDGDPATHKAWENNEVVANNATFISNLASDEGGAVFIKSGKFKADTTTFTKNIAEGYDGHSGGAITIGSHRFNSLYSDEAYYHYASSAWATLDNCTFDGNEGTERGGAINQYRGVSYIHNCTFKNNQAYLRGGAFYGEGWGFSFQNNNRYIHNKIREEAFGTQIFCSNFGWIFANNLYVKGNDKIADDSDSNNAPVSISSRIILTNSTIIANLKNWTGIGCLRFENSYGYLYNSILLSTNTTNKNSIYVVGFNSTLQGNHLDSYHCLLGTYANNDAALNGNRAYQPSTSDVTGLTTANLGGLSYTDTGYAWTGNYTSSLTPAALKDEIYAVLTFAENIPSYTESPAYMYYKGNAGKATDSTKNGLAQDFYEWVDSKGAWDKDIDGNSRETNYPGCFIKNK